MKKQYLFMFVCLITLSACDKKPDYILNKTATCTTTSDVLKCADMQGNDITGTIGEYWTNRKKQTWLETKNGKAEGIVYQYYENGALKSEQHYANGKQNGIRRDFYLNNKLKLEANYENGVEIGPFKSYYENGNLRLSSICQNGVKNATNVKQYYENGGIYLEIESYKNGKADGFSRQYYENGKKQSEAFFSEGVQYGVEKHYDRDGKLISEENYENGVPVEKFILNYDTFGDLVYKEIQKDGKETGILYQDKIITREELDKKLKEKEFFDNIKDCEQAVAKATQKRLSFPDEDTFLYYGPVTVDKNGVFEEKSEYEVIDFASEGVFIKKSGLLSSLFSTQRYFVYTQDKDYATNEKFRLNGKIYKKTGNYKYTTLLLGTNSVPAFKATKYKISEIDPKTYLKNKSLSCCQHTTSAEKGFKEVGFASGSGYIFKKPSFGLDSIGCKTRNHPQGYSGYQYTIYTGTDYQKDTK